MKHFATRLHFLVLLIAALGFSPGCASTDGGDTQVSGSMYYGVGLYDPWYHGEVYYPPDVIVTPPPDRPAEPPPHVEHPIATPPSNASPSPRPMPSIPSTPRPAFRR